MFKYAEGECVAVRENKPEYGLTSGATGKVWALYDTDPPAYEVTFSTEEGDEFDALMDEDELTYPIRRNSKRLRLEQTTWLHHSNCTPATIL